MRLRKVKDRGQSTKPKRLQWSLVKVKDRGGHNLAAALVRDVCVSQITASFKVVISSVCRRYVHGHLSSQPYGVLEKIMLILCVSGLQESFFLFSLLEFLMWTGKCL